MTEDETCCKVKIEQLEDRTVRRQKLIFCYFSFRNHLVQPALANSDPLQSKLPSQLHGAKSSSIAFELKQAHPHSPQEWKISSTEWKFP